MTARKQRRMEAVAQEVVKYGADVLDSASHQSCAKYIQHGTTNIQDHTISVACMCVKLTRVFHLQKYDHYDLIRGALLHDYFLYDWHVKDENRKGLHGYTHASEAVQRAAEDFSVTPRMASAMKTHMWPLNIAIPHTREAWILTTADKICSFNEIFRKPYYYAVFDQIKGKL